MKVDGITFPKGHQIGMKVPVGGSDCAKCEYVSDDKKHCGQKQFQEWNGSDLLPAKADRYCCDFFQYGSPSSMSATMRARRASQT